MWPFGKNKRSDKNKKLYFKSNNSFFQYICKYGHTKIEPPYTIVAQVVDWFGKAEMGPVVEQLDDGRQSAWVVVASEDGGFVVKAETPFPKGDKLSEGDLVLWVPIEHNSMVRLFGTDERIGWLGAIVAKIAPTIDVESDTFEIISGYD